MATAGWLVFPGGDATIGTELIARAKPGGDTLLSAAARLAAYPGLPAKQPHDALRYLAPVTTLGRDGFGIAANEKQPHRTIAELVAAARKPYERHQDAYQRAWKVWRNAFRSASPSTRARAAGADNIQSRAVSSSSSSTPVIR